MFNYTVTYLFSTLHLNILVLFGKNSKKQIPHGHAALGRLHDDDIASYQARCITFARMGCVAFMWDMVDYNDCAMQLQGEYQEKSYWLVHKDPWIHENDRKTLWNAQR